MTPWTFVPMPPLITSWFLIPSTATSSTPASRMETSLSPISSAARIASPLTMYWKGDFNIFAKYYYKNCRITLGYSVVNNLDSTRCWYVTNVMLPNLMVTEANGNFTIKYVMEFYQHQLISTNITSIFNWYLIIWNPIWQ